jgi:hypothetical protein
MKLFAIAFGLATVAASVLPGASTKDPAAIPGPRFQGTRPNIVLILVDD